MVERTTATARERVCSYGIPVAIGLRKHEGRPADDANLNKSRYPEGVREGMQGYQLRLKAASVFLGRFLITDVVL